MTVGAGRRRSAPEPIAGAALHLSVDVVALTIRDGQLSVLLVERPAPPYEHAWALPGRLLGPEEDADHAAARDLAEQADITVGTDPSSGSGPPGTAGGHLEQLRTYSAPDRDPRGRVVSVAYLATLPAAPALPPDTGPDRATVRFWPVEDLDRRGTGDGVPLAFDHAEILADGLERLRAKLEYTTLAASFCPEPFSISDLRRVYEAVWGVPLHSPNFYRKVLSTPGFVVPTGKTRGPGRPTQLYRRGPALELHPPLMRPDTEDEGPAPGRAVRAVRS